MRKILPVILAIVLVGCASYDNFTTLFNTYYNAKRIMMEVEDSFAYEKEKDRDKPRVIVAEQHTLAEEETLAKPKPEFLKEFVVPANHLKPVETKVDSILMKGSKILANHPKSAYVDGSLFLMAKSHFFKSEWQQSQIKCQELMDVRPNSDFAPEIHLILAKNYFMQERYESGEQALSRTVDIAWGQNNYEVLSEAFRLQAELALYEENIDDALKPYRRAVSQGDDGGLRATWQFEIGAILYRKNEFERAYEEFEAVFNHSPNILVEFEAQLYMAACLARLGRFDESRDLLEELADNSNFEEWKGWTWAETMNLHRQEIAYQMDSVTSLEQGNTANIKPKDIMDLRASIGENERVLEGMEQNADTAYIGNGAVAAYYFQRGLDKFHEGRYTDARKYFSQSKVVRSPVHIEAGRYFELLNTWEKKTAMALPLMGRFNETGTGSDSLRADVAAALFETGRVHERLGNPDSALVYYDYAAHTCPVDNEARAKYLFASARMVEFSDYDRFYALYQEIFDKYPLTEYGEIAREEFELSENAIVDPVLKKYQGGERQLESERFPGAARQFAGVAENHPGSDLAPRSLYLAGWVWERKLNDNDSAFTYYKRLVDRYPDSEYALDVLPSVMFAMAKRDGLNLDSLQKATQSQRARRTDKGDETPPGVVVPFPEDENNRQKPKRGLSIPRPQINLPTLDVDVNGQSVLDDTTGTFNPIKNIFGAGDKDESDKKEETRKNDEEKKKKKSGLKSDEEKDEANQKKKSEDEDADAVKPDDEQKKEEPQSEEKEESPDEEEKPKKE